MTIGNDVIDLRDPETRTIHPRFDERVMAASERAWLAKRAVPERDRWLLWAAKEAAYKAARRLDPALVFAPSRFVVELDEAGEAHVTVGRERFDVLVRVIDDAIHAVATLAGTPRSAIIATSSRSDEPNPSVAVRQLATDIVSGRRGAAFAIAMRGRLPELHADRQAPIPLSLAHHGEVVGFAAVLA